MSEAPKADVTSFPGGHDDTEIIAAVKLAEMKHVGRVPLGELEHAIIERFLTELAGRHPEMVPFGDPYRVRSQELFDQRRSLAHSHLALSWFSLAYWAYGLIAVRSGLSVAEYGDPRIFIVPVRGALRELGVHASEEECLEEVDRFLPLKVSARSVEAATHTFLSFVRFLHRAAIRRRQVVTPGLTFPSMGLVFTQENAREAETISTFLTCHGVSLLRQPDEATPGSRLLVLLSRDAIGAEAFWRRLEGWNRDLVTPMALCLMPKADLYREPPFDTWKEIWDWLGHSVAVELGARKDRYVVLLRALDSSDPKQWWWKYDDTVEIGLAADVLGEGIPRPRARSRATGPDGEAYPFSADATVLTACVPASFAACAHASEGFRKNEATGRDARYVAICDDLLPLRQKPNGEPYALPWFMLVYRAWLMFAARFPGSFSSEEDPEHAELELRFALFALGIGTQRVEAATFLDAFARLPWEGAADPIAAVSERTAAFTVLVSHLTQAALAAGQRVRLQQPVHSCFVSYARPDEGVARELVKFLESKGADVWFDVNAITLGTPLDDSLRSAVADARFLFLVATPAADHSSYVRLEIETAIQNGLHIVPITPDGRLPPGIASLQASAPGSFGDLIPAPDADRANAFPLALARLQRTPEDQLRWLQAQPLYASLSNRLTQARVQFDKAGR